jgi:hypothetical protein
MVEEGGWWEVIEVSKAITNFSEKFIFGFGFLTFQKQVPWFLETSKNCNNPWSLQGWSHKGWVWFFVRILEVVIGGSRCVAILFSILSSGVMVSRKSNRVICVGWGIYSIVCKLKLKFPWKSNVVLDLCGSKDFEKRCQWVQESEIIIIWPCRNLKLLYDVKCGFFASF